MFEMIRARIGEEPTYLPADGEKKAVTYVSVVKTTRVQENGQWVDGDPVWYKAQAV